MAYNSAYTGSQVDAAVGAVRQKETIWDGKQDELTGTEDQLVGFNSSGEAVAVAKPDPLPAGGETGQVLTKTAEGTAWDDIPSDLPAGGTAGQVLTKGEGNNVEWSDPASGLPSGGTTGQMLYQGESWPEWDDKPVMYVNITDIEGELSADKTVDEIKAAVEKGYSVFCNFGDNLYCIGDNQEYDRVRFFGILEVFAADERRKSISKITIYNDGYAEMSDEIVATLDYETGILSDSQRPTYTATDVGAIPNPPGGTAGQILEKTATGTQWADKPSGGISQSEADARYLQLSGGTMTGGIQFPYGGFVQSYQGPMSDVFSAGIGSSPSDSDAKIEITGGSISIYPSGGELCAVFNQNSLNMQNRPITNCPSIIAPPDRKTATLSASGWSGNSQTITVNGVITDTSAQDIDISCADKASADAWAAGGVWCSNPTQANKLTFTCTTPPTANINLNIRLWEVG